MWAKDYRLVVEDAGLVAGDDQVILAHENVRRVPARDEGELGCHLRPEDIAIAAKAADYAVRRHYHHHRHHHHAYRYNIPWFSYLHNYGPGPLPNTWAYYDGPTSVRCKQSAAAYRGQACGFMRKPADVDSLRRLAELMARLCAEALEFPDPET